MAFIGIFILGAALWLFFCLIALTLLLIVIPCIVLAIINLVQGLKNNWPKRNIITLSITGTISIIFILLITFLLVAVFRNGDPTISSSSTSIEETFTYLTSLIK